MCSVSSDNFGHCRNRYLPKLMRIIFSNHVIFLFCAAALLAGCATPQGPPIAQIPVPIACLPANLPVLPEMARPETLVSLPDYQLVLTISTEWYELKAWASQIVPALEACK